MTADPGKLTLHMVSSLDGKIASKDNSVFWFEAASNYEKGVAGQDPAEFLKSIDCYVMGSHTYELALTLSATYGWVYGDKPTIVVTGRSLPNDRPNIEFYAGDLRKLVEERLKPAYKNVWIVGGASLAMSFLNQHLVDEIRLTVLPIILGEGLSFFNEPLPQQLLRLKDVTAYKNGMVELIYEIPRE